MFPSNLLLLSALLLPWTQESGLTAPRRILPKDPTSTAQVVPGAPASLAILERRVVVKFMDATRARARADGALTSASGADLRAARDLAASLGARFEALVRLDEQVLTDLETRAAAQSGRAQPDLAGMLIARVTSSEPAALESIAAALRALDVVEFAYVQELGMPPPGDIAPTTPNLTAFQTWHQPVSGLNSAFLVSQGLNGSSVQLSDCEYGWVSSHEDLVDINLHLEPGQTPHPSVAANGWDEHGTAVIGETSGVINGYGCNGLIPAAEVYTFPEWTVEEGFRRVTAITNAIAGSAVGDVVLLEMQNGSGAPAEVDPAVWVVVKVGTDAGVVVVGAAGNGNQNLDSAGYANYMALGDSGAILVGAGTPDASHAKLSFSSYGSRIDLQGWGFQVFTLGYGDFAAYGGDKNQRYTSAFSGTSSASPMVTIAAVAAQDYMLQTWGQPLTPKGLRAVLRATGIPQTGAGGAIGPFPDIAAAISALGCQGQSSFCVAAANSTGAGGVLNASGSSSHSVNALVLTATKLPPAQPALFIYGQGNAQLPFGNGWLCIGGGSVLRLLPAAQISAGGVVSYALDLEAPIMSSGPGQITPGSTWNFQCWFRDVPAGGAGFNLTDAVAVTFCN